jgi:cbb3-type cytochrome oxidase maturation protein
MNILGLMIPMALLLGLGFLAAFFWSLAAGQFEDPEGAALRVLLDDDKEADEA